MATVEEPRDRSPVEEIANRSATAGSGLAAAAQAVGLQAHQRMLAEAERRTREGHLAMMRAAGFEPSQLIEEQDDMGNISVSGDTHVQMVPDSQPNPQQPASAGRSLLPYVLAAALGMGGVGLGVTLPVISSLLTRPSPTPTTGPDADTQYQLEFGDPKPTGAPENVPTKS